MNFPPYMRDVFAARNRPRLIEILESLAAPDDLPDVYRDTPEDRFTRSPRLAPFSAARIFEDRVLGVGLKAYPYVIDWNNDGRKDLLVGDHDGFIYVYLNEGTDDAPVFGRGERLRAADTGEPLIIAPNPKMSFGDLTGSGSLDLVLGDYGPRVHFIPNRAAAGGFEFAVRDMRYLRTRSGVIDVGNYAYPELVDWNGDGRLDLVVGNIDGALLIFRNVTRSGGDLLFDGPEHIPGVEPVMYPHPVFCDWNNNGKKDLTLGHREGTVIIYLNVGTDTDPRFERHDVARLADGRPVRVSLLSHQCVVDWNNNGKLDLIIGNDPGQVILFENIGTREEPVFAQGRKLMDSGGELIMGVHSIFAMPDLHATGRPDLLVGHSEETLRIFPNVGTAEEPEFDDFAEMPDIAMSREILAVDDPDAERFWALDGLRFNTEYLGNCAPCPVDWNNDGRLDILVGNYTGLIYLFENVGSPAEPRFAPGVPLRCGDRLLRVAGFAAPVVCDWNNDGRKDLVVGDLLGRVHVFRNTGADEAPAFERDMMLTVSGEPVALGPRTIVDVADLDGDGRKDVIIGNRRGHVYALMNIGSDAEPAFDTVERLRDASALWRRLYAGLQHCCPELKRLYANFPAPDDPKPMMVVETSCPRVVDLAGRGRPRLLVSHRYGRVFIYNHLPNPAR